MAEALLTAASREANDTKTYDNGVKVVPSYLLGRCDGLQGQHRDGLVDTGYWTSRTDGQSAAGPVARRTAGRARAPLPAVRPGSTIHVDPPTRRTEQIVTDYILEMRGITKTFPGVKALSGRQLRRSSAARSTRSAARTAPASRPS